MPSTTASNEYDEAKTNRDRVQYWIGEISAAKKREQSYRKLARAATELYEGGGERNSSKPVAYNVLYSNTETLAPALYNTTPRPVVQRRFKDEDPLAKVGAQVVQRLLEHNLDDGELEYSVFDDLMKAAVLEALVPGRGVTRFKYDAKIDEKGGKVDGQKVCGEEVPWDRFIHGYGKKWNQVPWIGYEHHMTKDEIKENFGKEKLIGLRMEASEVIGEDDDTDNSRQDEESRLVVVYEIWSKVHKKVFFVTLAQADEFLKEVDDPLKLTGFFPSPKPLQFVQKISTLTPVPLYTMYEDQAKELNTITVRLNALIRACRVRGIYNSAVQGIADALKADDNVLTPADNVASIGNMNAALDAAIWLFPIDKLIQTIQQLYLARQQVKSVIFELTGIADIMRGSSQASETLGAQEIKNQWGTLRLKRTQKEVQRYVRDSLRIVAEIAVTKLPKKTIIGMTGLPLMTDEQKAQAQAMVQQATAEHQMMSMQAQQSGQQPPPAPQPPPGLMEALQAPTWEEILKFLRDDTSRTLRIDIETNSTVDAEATEDKQNISELLNAMAQFLNGVAPLIEQGIMPFEGAKTMLLMIARRFRFGTDAEDALKTMKQPEPKADPKIEADQKKLEADMQMRQMDMQAQAQRDQVEGQKAQMDMQLKQQEHQLELEKMKMEMQKMQMEMAFRTREHELKMAELQANAVVQQVSTATKLQGQAQSAELQRQSGEMKSQQMVKDAAFKESQRKAQAKNPKADSRPD